MYTKAMGASPFGELSKENDFIAYLLMRNMIIMYPFAAMLQLIQFVIMGGEQSFGLRGRLL
jgi:hypothetical protein